MFADLENMEGVVDGVIVFNHLENIEGVLCGFTVCVFQCSDFIQFKANLRAKVNPPVHDPAADTPEHLFVQHHLTQADNTHKHQRDVYILSVLLVNLDMTFKEKKRQISGFCR